MPADFLQLAGKRVVVFGVANRKSVAYHVGQVLQEAEAEVVYVVRNPQRRDSVAKLLEGAPIYVCDVEHQDQIDQLSADLAEHYDMVHGVVHSIASATTPRVPSHFTRRAETNCYGHSTFRVFRCWPSPTR